MKVWLVWQGFWESTLHGIYEDKAEADSVCAALTAQNPEEAGFVQETKVSRLGADDAKG